MIAEAIAKVHNKRHIVGLILLVFSLAPVVTEGRNVAFISLSYGAFCLGVVFVSDYIVHALTGQSYLSRVLQNNKARIQFFTLSLMAGIILEGFAAGFAGLWYYPYYSLPTYVIVAFFLKGFAWYFLCILLSYQAFKDIFDHILTPSKRKIAPYFFEKYLYNFLVIAGELCLAYVAGKILVNTDFLNKFYLTMTTPKAPFISFGDLMLVFFGMFCILEFIQHRKRRNSFLFDVIHGYWNPVFAVVAVSVVVGIYLEFQNVPVGFWVYANWPQSKIAIFNLPLTMFLAWPLHYIFFLSFYRAFDNTASRYVWIRGG